MAREYAAIKVGIWQDDGFRAYTPAAQHLYFVLATSPDVSFCGALDWRPKRLLPRAKGWTDEALHAAAVELSEGRLIIVDEDTEECLIRSFLRHDGVMQHNKMCISAMLAFGEVASNTIRGVIVHELRRLREDFPEWPAWERDQVREVLKRNALAPHLAPSLAPAVAPAVAANGAAGSAPGVAPSVHQHQHQHQSTSASTADAHTSDATRRRPERPLPQEWQPNDKHRAFATEKSVDVEREARAFRNHADTNDRRARNWDAAFRTWLDKARPAQQQPTSTPGRREQPAPESRSIWDTTPTVAELRARDQAALEADR